MNPHNARLRTYIALGSLGLFTWLGLCTCRYGHWRQCELYSYTPELYVKSYIMRVPFAGRFEYWEFVDQHNRVLGRRIQWGVHRILPVVGQTIHRQLVMIDCSESKSIITLIDGKSLSTQTRFAIGRVVRDARLSSDGKWLLLQSPKQLTLLDLQNSVPTVVDGTEWSSPDLSSRFIWHAGELWRYDRGRIEIVPLPSLKDFLVSCLFVDNDAVLLVGESELPIDDSQAALLAEQSNETASNTTTDDETLLTPDRPYKFFVVRPLEDRVEEVNDVEHVSSDTALIGNRLFQVRRGRQSNDLLVLNRDGTEVLVPPVSLVNQRIYELMQHDRGLVHAAKPNTRILHAADLTEFAYINRNASLYWPAICVLCLLACVWCAWWCAIFEPESRWTMLSSGGCIVMASGLWFVIETSLDLSDSLFATGCVEGLYFVPAVYCARWVFAEGMSIGIRIGVAWLVYVSTYQTSYVPSVLNIHYVVVAILLSAVVKQFVVSWKHGGISVKFSITELLLWTLCIATVQFSLLWKPFHLFPAMFVWEAFVVAGATLMFYRSGMQRWCGAILLVFMGLLSWGATVSLDVFEAPEFLVDIMHDYPSLVGLIGVLGMAKLAGAVGAFVYCKLSCQSRRDDSPLPSAPAGASRRYRVSGAQAASRLFRDGE